MIPVIRQYFLFLFIAILSVGCAPAWQVSSKNVTQYRVKPDSPKDSGLTNFLKPYYQQMAATMDKIIAVSDVELIKKQPSCNMGNFFSDVVKAAAEERYAMPIDLVVFNHGGMRLTSLAPGNVTIGKVYELSPFDNLIVVLKINGKTLQELLDLTAYKGGWPVSGATYFIKNKKAIDVLVAGNPIDIGKTYTLATIDYVANGGDNADMLRPIPQLNKNLIMRDAIISYLEKLTAQGKHIVDIPEKRVQYAE